ncbi:MAG: helix-hairpin-helix domain-containing protein [Thermoplasmatota archaeon]
MPENDSSPSSEPIKTDQQVEKEVMVKFLTSTGRIRPSLASTLYDGGLNSWSLLMDGDKEYFIGFKGVGVKTAEVLIELGGIKAEEVQCTVKYPDVREVLSEVPRINQQIIAALVDGGYDSILKFRGAKKEELMEFRGVGPKLSESIMEVTARALDECEMAGIPDEAEAELEEMKEEAAGAEPEKAEPRESLIDRIIKGIKGFFGGKAKEQTAEEKKDAEEPGEEEAGAAEVPVEPEIPEEEAEPASESTEKAEGGVTEESGQEKEEHPAEESMEIPEEVEEAPGEEEAEREVPLEAEEEKPVEEKTPDDPPEEPVKEEPAPAERTGFLDRIMAIFKGGKKETPPEEPAEVQQAEPPAEDEKEEGIPDEEEAAPESQAEAEEEKPVEEEPAEAPPEEEGLPAEEEAAPGSKEIKEFEDIPGVSKKIAKLLRDSGYMNIDELKEAVPDDLMMIEGIGQKTAENICNAMKELQ